MLELFAIRQGRLAPVPGEADLRADVVWLDLHNPTPEEEARVEKMLGIDVPTREDMAEIEISSRLYHEDDTLFMTVVLLEGSGSDRPAAVPVTFILTRTQLVTVRYGNPGVFQKFVKQAAKPELGLKSVDAVFAALLEAVIDRTADILEKVAAETDAISGAVFRMSEAETATRDYKTALRRIGLSGDLNAKVRESLVSIGRLVNFLSAECAERHPELKERTDTMSADIRSLADHASFVSGNTVFLLDATLGLINIEQNAIIKIVSIVSVLVMPPTLVASIYGMNFRNMPELSWAVGYPLALGAMVVSAIIPFWYFKRRGWL